MKFEDMKLNYGYPLQLQSSNSAGQPERYSCRLIGCLPGRSILLSVPKLAGKLLRFRSGQKLVVRLMVDNGIGIFASSVEAQTTEPYPILHITCPDNVNFKGVRGATRVAIDKTVALANVTNTNIPISSARMVDISITGARIEAELALADIGNKIQLTMNLQVANINRDVTLEAIIRSCGEVNSQSIGVIAYGVEFVAPKEDKCLLLYAYVYGQISSEEIVDG